MNLFKVQSAPLQSWVEYEQQQQVGRRWSYFPPQQQIDQNSYINEVLQSKQDYFSSNPQVLFQQIMISFRKDYNMDQEVSKIIKNNEDIRFKLELKRPQFCMGAFTHNNTQPLFNEFDPNIVTPSPEQCRPFTNIINSQYKPFSSNFSNTKAEMEQQQQSSQLEFNRIMQSQSKYFKGGRKVSQISGQPLLLKGFSSQSSNFFDEFNNSKPTNIFILGQKQLQQSNLMIDELPYSVANQQKINQSRAFQLGLIEMNQQKEVSFIKQIERNINGDNLLNQGRDEFLLQKSIFSNFEQLNQLPEYSSLPAWQQSVIHPTLIIQINNKNQLATSQFEVSHEWHQSKLSFFQSNFSIYRDATYIISEVRLFVLIGEMLMGVENKLFWLDYDKCEWYVDLRGVRFEYVLRESFINIIHQQLSLANMLSRLRKFIQFTKPKKQRMLYFEISKIVQSTLQSLQSYLLQLTQEKQQQNNMLNKNRENNLTKQLLLTNNNNDNNYYGLLEFIMDLQQLTDEIRILYKLIIWQSDINKESLSYMSFSYKFIRPEFQIFQTIMKLSRQSDQIQQIKSNHLLRLLFQASFRPILLSLNKILFESISQITRKQEIYLKYYFQSAKQLLNQTSKRITLIYKQSPQLYLISKQRLNLSICFDLTTLKTYDQQWSQLFYSKFTRLQLVLSKMIQSEKQDRYEMQKKRRLQLQQLKQKLHEKSLKEKSLINQQKGRKQVQLEKLRRQIKQKQEKNRLQVLIQKQRERGYLLEGELRNKILLLKQKQRLLEELPSQHSDKLIKTTSIIMQMDREEPQQLVSNNIIEKISSNQIEQIKNNISSQNMIEQITPVVNLATQIFPDDNQLQNNNKEHRTRKIKKLPSNLRHKKQTKITGTLISQLSYQQNQSIIMKSSSTNFRELCQKSKQLNFQPISSTENQQETHSLQDHNEKYFQSDDEDDYQKTPEKQPYRQIQTIINTKQQSCTGTNAILDICIDKVIQNQIQVVNNCYEIIIFQKYHLKDLIKFMKATFLSENGQKQHTLLSVCCDTKTSKMTLKSFTECSLLDNLPHFIELMKPSFYHTRQQQLTLKGKQMAEFVGINGYYGQMDIISDNLFDHIGFQFASMPTILQPYFSYIHLSKYMQIFAFILRIKHCEMIVSELWITLNEFKKSLFNNYNNDKMYDYGEREFLEEKYEFEKKLLNRLFVVRHLIQSFLKTYQNYIFFRVIEKQFKILNKKIDRHQMSDLQISHEKVLDSIIRHAFVDNSTNNITKQIRSLLQLVRQFAHIVELLCENNILIDQQDQITNKIRFIHQHFKHNHKFFEALYFKT